MKAPGNGLLTKPNTKDTDDAGCQCFPITMLQESKVPQKQYEYSLTYFNLGTVLEAENFDSYGDSSAGNRLRDYLNGITG